MRTLATISALCLASGAFAQGSAPRHDCNSVTRALPAELAGWSPRGRRTATASAGAASSTALGLGRAAQLRLTPTPAVRYALRPEKPGELSGYGGLASFTILRSGIYRVALGSAAWVDVVRNGKAVKSVAHGHGPACSGIRKLVSFRLPPGRYLLQVSGNADPVIKAMVVPLR